MRVQFIFAAAALTLADVAHAADTVVLYDGTQIRGTVLRLNEGRIEIKPDGEGDVARIAVGDLSTVKLVPAPPDPEKHGSLLLIDNDGFHAPTEKSGKIKLREGLHAFTLLFMQGTQGATLNLQWEGPGLAKQEVPRNALFKWKTGQDEVTYSEGLDDEGFRKPDQLEESIAQVGFKLFEWSQNGIVQELGDLRNLVLKKYGTARQVNLNFQHAATNFGAVFYGFVKVPKDGEYTFYLNSDDGSQLYIGKVPQIAQPSIRAPGQDAWLLKFDENARLDVPVSGWDGEGVHGTLKIGGRGLDLVIPPTHVRELWTREYADKQSTIDRSDEPDDADTVYAKNADGQIQRVSGAVLGIADGAVKFDYQGQERSIALDRVAVVVTKKSGEAEQPPQHRVRILFDLCGEDQLVGHLANLTAGQGVIELPWGQTVTLSRNMIYKMIVLNGRMQSLQDLNPVEVAQTPFFDRVLAWQAGRAISGGGLRIGEKDYAKGLCLHSRTRLTYDLGGAFDRFQCDLGLQNPEGDLGNAAVRISADGAELFAAAEVTAQSAAQPLDLDVSGREQLTLEVDFGQDMDIGDHVVFGDARLLKPELAP